MEIGAKVFEVRGEDESIIEVFPRLINQMIVEVMKPEASKSAAIATFEALCNFWRTLRWLVDTRPTLRERIGNMLSKFISSEANRHKDNIPDLGVMLVLFTAFQGHTGCPTRSDFIQAYFDENTVRWVMWWQRSGTIPQPVPVFQATQVSREICMFDDGCGSHYPGCPCDAQGDGEHKLQASRSFGDSAGEMAGAEGRHQGL